MAVKLVLMAVYLEVDLLPQAKRSSLMLASFSSLVRVLRLAPAKAFTFGAAKRRATA